MSNPFLKHKQSNVANQQPAPVINPLGTRAPEVNAFSTSAMVPPPANTSYNSMPMGGRSAPPPPPVSVLSNQMANMNLNSNAPPKSGVSAPPSAANTGSYLPSKGRYVVPSNAYQYASATHSEQANQGVYSPDNAAPNAAATPSYIGTGTTYDSAAPAPTSADPDALPDEEYVKLSYEIAPNSPSLEGMSGMPFGAVFRPMAADGVPIPVVSLGAIGVQRCKRCRLYVNPFVQFIDAGRRWKCNMCGYINDVPTEYYSQIDSNGRRLDLAQRPELLKGQVEFIAGPEYCLRPPVFPTYMFLIDVSYQSVASGMLSTVCTSIRNSVDGLLTMCDNGTVNVGFMTFDSTVHFYKITPNSVPRQLIVSEIEETFVPIPSSLLINLGDYRDAVDSFLENLPSVNQNTKNVDSCTGNALQFAAKLLEDCGGKILLFQASIPSYGIGKLKVRESPALLGTEAEKELLSPSLPFYTELGTIQVEKQISIDVFLGSAQYSDIATLSSLCRTTGGQFFYYPSFQSESPQAESLYGDIFHDLTRETGFEAVYRVRVPQGAKVSAFYGNFTLSNTDLMVIPVCHADMTIVLEFRLEAVLSMPCFPIQSALLYTNSRGERRIRVHTLSIPISNILSHLYERVNQDVIISILFNQSVRNLSIVGPSVTRQKIHQQCIQLVKRAKAQDGGKNTQQLPDKMNLIPLYLMAMQKSCVCRGGNDQKSDSRSYVMQQIQQCGVELLLKVLYPTLMVLSSMNPLACTYAEQPDTVTDDIRLYGNHHLILPSLTNLSLSALSAAGIYLLDDGLSLWLLLGSQVSSTDLSNLFGVSSLDGYDISSLRLPTIQTELNQKIHTLMEELRMDRPYFCPLYIVRVTDQEFSKLKWRLIEDRDMFPGSNYSYAEYVQLIVGGNSGY